MCSICCCSYTHVARAPITCLYCEFEACTRCVKTYLLEALDDPHCMKCRAGWNMEFLDEHLSMSFRKGELAKHRKDILIDREKALLPATVDAANREKQRRLLAAQARELSFKIKTLRQELVEAERLRRDIYETIGDINTAGFSQQERRQFVRACPAEDCRGFLTTQWRCQLCEVHVCSECHEVKGGDHVCKPENVQTAQMIARDTKPCPKCGALIHKIDGCDQMWCLSCKTAFSWRTLRVEVGQIHNPEYYRWMRESGQNIPAAREEGDCRQDRLPSIHYLVRILTDKGIWNEGLSPILRCATHIRHVEYNQVARRDYDADPNQDLRIKYLLNELSEECWKVSLLKRETRKEKMRAAANLYEMFIHVASDLLRRALQSATCSHDIDGLLEEFERLRLYYNSSRDAIHERFGTLVVRFIEPDWNLL